MRLIARSHESITSSGGNGIGAYPIDAVTRIRLFWYSIGSDAIALMIRAAISSSFPALRRRNEDEELLAAPADDHVGLPERVAQRRATVTSTVSPAACP
mgnify:CR=1 FL=1